MNRVGSRLFAIVVASVALLSLCACKSQAERSPLPEDTLIGILSEMHVADAFTERNKESLVYRNELRKSLYHEILTHFEVDEQTFRAAYDYYIARPDLMDSLYQKIVVKLENQMEGEREYLLAHPEVEEKLPEDPPKEVPIKAPWQSPGRTQDSP